MGGQKAWQVCTKPLEGRVLTFSFLPAPPWMGTDWQSACSFLPTLPYLRWTNTDTWLLTLLVGIDSKQATGFEDNLSLKLHMYTMFILLRYIPCKLRGQIMV